MLVSLYWILFCGFELLALWLLFCSVIGLHTGWKIAKTGYSPRYLISAHGPKHENDEEHGLQ